MLNQYRAEEYINDVLNEKVLVCELTRLAVNRHVNGGFPLLFR